MTRQGEELERDMREMPKVCPWGRVIGKLCFFLIKFIWLFAFPGEEIVLNGFSLYFVRGLG